MSWSIDRGLRRNVWLWLLPAGAIGLIVGTIIALRALAGSEPEASAPLDALRARAQDRSAQSDLRNAMTAAKAYFVAGDTYDGFDPPAAEAIEPNILWMWNQPAEAGLVTINLARGDVVVLSTRSESGAAFCIAEESAVIVYGRKDAVDARGAADCGSAPGW